MKWPWSRPVEIKENPVGSVISAWTVGQPVWTERRFDMLAQEGYVKNAVAFKCVKMIASGAAMVPWMLSNGRKELETHPLLDLLSRPAPMIGGHALFEAFYAFLLLQGNTYIAAQRPTTRAGPPKELWNLRPDRMKVIAGPYGIPQGYEYEASGQKKTFPVDPMTGMGDILHVKEFHPINDWYGMGRVEAGAYGIDRHNAASAHNKALLDNGARPSGALVFKPVNDGTKDVSAPQAAIDEARKLLESRYGGADNAGKPMTFGGNVSWEEMGINPKDMDFANGKDDAARDICAAFGVPHVLIVPGASTYNNVREAKLELWEDTILPLMDKTVDALNAWLCPMYGDGLRLEYDLDEISALEPRREAKRTSVVQMFDKGLIDDAEARDALQYGPRPEGALRLQRGDGPILQALVSAARDDPAMIEPLYRYLIGAGLIDQATSLDAFISSWDTGPSPEEMLAAAGLRSPTDPNASANSDGTLPINDGGAAL